jgi:response regulator NasT
MKRLSLDEATAFQRLQKMARDKNKKLVEVAEMILAVEDVYGEQE